MSKTCKDIFETDIGGRISKDPAKAKTVNAIYAFDVTGDGGGKWTVDLKSDPPAVKAGDAGNAECTITVSAQDFLDIDTGKLNPQVAFMSGKLRIKGDMSKAMKLGQVLKG
jgi:putative sterol carrier protein